MDEFKTTSTTLSHSDVEFKQGDDTKVIDGRQFAIVPTRAICDARVGKSTLHVLAAYCMYAQKSWGQYRMTMVGQTRIAREIGLKQCSVSGHVQKLRRLGYMTFGKRPRHKYGTAQTHLIFYGAPATLDRRGVDDIIDKIEAQHNPSEVAPPVPISGVVPIRTDGEQV
jgi:hypothetical protein